MRLLKNWPWLRSRVRKIVKLYGMSPDEEADWRVEEVRLVGELNGSDDAVLLAIGGDNFMLPSSVVNSYYLERHIDTIDVKSRQVDLVDRIHLEPNPEIVPEEIGANENELMASEQRFGQFYYRFVEDFKKCAPLAKADRRLVATDKVIANHFPVGVANRLASLELVAQIEDSEAATDVLYSIDWQANLRDADLPCDWLN